MTLTHDEMIVRAVGEILKERLAKMPAVQVKADMQPVADAIAAMAAQQARQAELLLAQQKQIERLLVIMANQKAQLQEEHQQRGQLIEAIGKIRVVLQAPEPVEYEQEVVRDAAGNVTKVKKTPVKKKG